MIRTCQTYHISGFSVGNQNHAPIPNTAKYNTIHLFPAGTTLKQMMDSNREGKQNEPLMISSQTEFRPTLIACKNTLGVISVPYDVANELREQIKIYDIVGLVFHEGSHGEVQAIGITATGQYHALLQIKQSTFWESAIYDEHTTHLDHCMGKMGYARSNG